MENAAHWRESLTVFLDALYQKKALDHRHVLVIGASTSEVIGKNIGSAGSEEVAEDLFQEFASFREKTGVHLAFQGCEHINRAITVEKETADLLQLEPVSAVPHPRAGGAMASRAYRRMKDPVVVEHIQADAGIDIGDTFIGMHMKHVAVPVRTSIDAIGSAHVTMAVSRPKLIGGERARYTVE